MSNQRASVEQAMAEFPLVAILRGLDPDNAIDVGEVLIEQGFSLIEVPLNSPKPFESIRKLRDALPERIVIGAGTVTQLEEVKRLADAGGEIAVSPNINPDVITASLAAGIEPMPGFSTPTEAFQAIEAGARYLKLFPASIYPVGYVKALKSVLPAQIKILAVGGIEHHNCNDFLAAGFDGLGIGGCLFKVGMSLNEVVHSAERFVCELNKK